MRELTSIKWASQIISIAIELWQILMEFGPNSIDHEHFQVLKQECKYKEVFRNGDLQKEIDKVRIVFARRLFMEATSKKNAREIPVFGPSLRCWATNKAWIGLVWRSLGTNYSAYFNQVLSIENAYIFSATFDGKGNLLSLRAGYGAKVPAGPNWDYYTAIESAMAHAEYARLEAHKKELGSVEEMHHAYVQDLKIRINTGDYA